MTSHEERIAKEEEFWTGPRLFAYGLAFLAAAVAVIYLLSSI